MHLETRAGPHKIKIGGEVLGDEVEEKIMVVELEILLDLVEGEVVLVDTGEEEEGVALGL